MTNPVNRGDETPAEAGTGARGGSIPMPVAPPPFNVVTIECYETKNQISGMAPTTTPGGQRLHVSYTGGGVTLSSSGVSNVTHVVGRVLSGGDWLLIRSDDVAVFDAHFTLGKSLGDVSALANLNANFRAERDKPPPPDDFLVDVFIAGQAPLPVSAIEFLSTRQTISVALPARFDAASRVETWAKPRFKELAKTAERFKHLVKTQCVARGTVTVACGKVVELNLTIEALTP